MFKLAQSAEYFWPVKFSLPVEGGRFEKSTFDCLFKRLSQSRIDEIILAANSGAMKDSDIAREIVVGWRGVTDDKGDEIEFSTSAFGQLLDVPMMATHIAGAFIDSLAEARRKN
jgi:hypothetical protein